MLGRLFLITTVSLFLTHSLSSDIIESNHIEDILNYVDNDTLVIFDIDNTIGKIDKIIGSDAWFYYMLNKEIQTGKTLDQAIDDLEPLSRTILEHSWLVPLEKNTPALIHSLQSKKIKTIALTSRSSTMSRRTLEQLNHIGIDFQSSSIAKKNFSFTFDKNDMHKKVSHKSGAIFCGKNNKGDILLHIFILLNYYPKKVIFIDDKKQYLDNVQQAMNRMGIEFIGIRYGACDQEVNKFDPQKAEKELAEFLSQETTA